jgi:hypothetical protein
VLFFPLLACNKDATKSCHIFLGWVDTAPIVALEEASCVSLLIVSLVFLMKACCALPYWVGSGGLDAIVGPTSSYCNTASTVAAKTVLLYMVKGVFKPKCESLKQCFSVSINT